ncbi:MAG TPA: hypothetical protein VIV60_27325 [Polyangiaceae bacterium]
MPRSRRNNRNAMSRSLSGGAGIPSVTALDEVVAHLSAEAKRSIERVSHHAASLECVGNLIVEGCAELHHDVPAEFMISKASALECLALRGNQLLTEIQREATRLETIAALRSATEGELRS